MKILHVASARPNFMRIAPVILPEPDVNLQVCSGSHAWQTAQVMQRFEPVLTACRPDWVLVPGDVNSMLACALAAVKLGFRVAHLEAGLRSFDRGMPEEINRLLTDQLSDLLLTPSPDADRNLLREKIPAEKIARVGNVMIDTLVRLRPKAELRWPGLSWRWDRRGQGFALVTLHRPSNVDQPMRLGGILEALGALSREMPVLFPVHPGPRRQLGGWELAGASVRLVEPLGYFPGGAVSHRAGQHRTPHHDRGRNQPPGGRGWRGTAQDRPAGSGRASSRPAPCSRGRSRGGPGSHLSAGVEASRRPPSTASKPRPDTWRHCLHIGRRPMHWSLGPTRLS